MTEQTRGRQRINSTIRICRRAQPDRYRRQAAGVLPQRVLNWVSHAAQSFRYLMLTLTAGGMHKGALG